jgi:hypothetical protein
MPRQERGEPLLNALHRVARIDSIRGLNCPVLAVLADGQYHAGLLKFFE